MDVELRGEPGSWRVDLYQAWDYAAVATNFSTLEGATGGVVVLPDESVRIFFRDLWVPNPVTPALHDGQGSLPRTPVHEKYSVEITRTRLNYSYYGPTNLTRPDDPPAQNNRSVHWPKENGVGFDRVGPFYSFVPGDSTDNAIDGTSLVVCRVRGGDVCEQVPVRSVGEGAKDRLPNVVFGLDYHQAEVATDPRALSYPVRGAAQDDAAREASERGMPAAADLLVPVASPAAEEAPPKEAAPPEHPVHRPEPPWPKAAAAVTAAARAGDDSSAGLSARLFAAAGGAALTGAALALYRRLTRRDLLEQETRRALLALVAAEPGVRLSTVARALGIQHRAVDYHVHLLASCGSVVVRRVRGQKRLFLAGDQPRTREEALVLSLAGQRATGAILGTLARSSCGATRRELRAGLDVSVSTFNWSLRQLVAERLVRQETRAARDGGPAVEVFALEPEARRVLLRASRPRAAAPARSAAAPTMEAS